MDPFGGTRYVDAVIRWQNCKYVSQGKIIVPCRNALHWLIQKAVVTVPLAVSTRMGETEVAVNTVPVKTVALAGQCQQALLREGKDRDKEREERDLQPPVKMQQR